MMTGRLKDLTMNRDGTQNITVTVSSDFRESFDGMKDGEVDIEIRRHHRKRSLDANAYAWVLIDQIAKKMHVGKGFVYRMVIREIGGVSETICVQTEHAERMKRWWEAKGMGWQAEAFESKIPGCTNLTLYCGSSAYDTAQMHQMIEALIQEAEGLGIPTISKEEEARMMGQWNRKTERKQEDG